MGDRGVEVRHADFSGPGSVGDSFGERGWVLLMPIEDPLFDIKGRAFHASAIKECASAGVGHLLYTSAIGAFLFGDGSPFEVQADAECVTSAEFDRYYDDRKLDEIERDHLPLLRTGIINH